MMSRIGNVRQASGYDRRISHRLEHLPCGKCCAVIEYDQGTEWGVVSGLVNEHVKACPMKPHASPAHMARTPTSPPDTEIALPLVAPEQHSSSNSVAESVGSQNNPCISTGCERKRRTLEQRKLELEQDEYAENITTKSVICGGCHKEISLDKRSDYYPGLWLKHRRKCPRIEKLERAKTRVPQTLESIRQVPCDSTVTSALCDNSHGGVLHPGPVEPYQSHNAAAKHPLVRHCDSEDLSSEDEDGDGELRPQRSFPILNYAFYWTQRHNNPSSEWAYRYATKDEITANFFHGQNEPYARPGSRPYTTPCRQVKHHAVSPETESNNQVNQEAERTG